MTGRRQDLNRRIYGSAILADILELCPTGHDRRECVEHLQRFIDNLESGPAGVDTEEQLKRLSELLECVRELWPDEGYFSDDKNWYNDNCPTDDKDYNGNTWSLSTLECFEIGKDCAPCAPEDNYSLNVGCTAAPCIPPREPW